MPIFFPENVICFVYFERQSYMCEISNLLTSILKVNASLCKQQPAFNFKLTLFWQFVKIYTTFSLQALFR